MSKTLNRIIHKPSKFVIGLLSGTSVDGIDAILIKISSSGLKTKVSVIDFITFKIPAEVRKSILKNSSENYSNLAEICRLNVILANLFAQAVKKIQRRNPKIKIDLIGSHGQTIHHLPQKGEFLGYKIKSTLQIGDPSVIANLTGITTAGDFRIADCAADGDGAPLVPYLDYILFRSSKTSRGLLNIGGIANITVIPKSASKDDVIAFDTGPGNMLVDGLVQIMFGKPFDRNSEIAKKGNMDSNLFEFLLRDAYFRQIPPKSTGREHYGSVLMKKILNNASGMPKENVIRTLTEFTAYTIWYNYENFISHKTKISELIVSGGGANNPLIMDLLGKYFEDVKIQKLNIQGITADSKEAVLFAVLANECINGNPANMKSVTGSKKDVILGKICLAN